MDAIAQYKHFPIICLGIFSMGKWQSFFLYSLQILQNSAVLLAIYQESTYLVYLPIWNEKLGFIQGHIFCHTAGPMVFALVLLWLQLLKAFQNLAFTHHLSMYFFFTHYIALALANSVKGNCLYVPSSINWVIKL